MVSKRIANPEMLGYDTIIAGRMMHVRIHYDKRAVDILALNQYVHHHTVESYHNRQSWWQHLGDTLSRLPTRNLLAGLCRRFQLYASRPSSMNGAQCISLAATTGHGSIS